MFLATTITDGLRLAVHMASRIHEHIKSTGVVLADLIEAGLLGYQEARQNYGKLLNLGVTRKPVGTVCAVFVHMSIMDSLNLRARAMVPGYISKGFHLGMISDCMEDYQDSLKRMEALKAS